MMPKDSNFEDNGIVWVPDTEVTLRDRFAGQALQAIIQADGIQFAHMTEEHARLAYLSADAMLVERSKP